MKVLVLVGAFNQEKALVGAFSMIVQLVVEPMDRFAALANWLLSRSASMKQMWRDISVILSLGFYLSSLASQ